MKVILTEKIPALGNVGEVVTVTPGYARNFLVPQKKAVVVDEASMGALKGQRRALSRKVQEEKDLAVEVKTKLDGVTLEFIRRVGANGKLFGSVTTSELAKELLKRGIEVERRNLHLDIPIKTTGTCSKQRAKLFSDIETDFSVKVEMDPVQAEEIKKRQLLAAKKKEEAPVEVKKAEENAEASAVPIAGNERRREVDGGKRTRSCGGNMR